jgi:hypothetical protein
MSTYPSNASEAVTLGDTAIFEAARQAVTLLKKTFETWLVIGTAVVRARDIADARGGGKTFMRLIEQQGLGPIVNKTTASVLLRIMERLPEVMAWRETLTTRQQIDWSAPTTVLKRCPIFNPPKPEPDEKPMTPAEKDRQALAVALEEIEQLKEREDGDRFKPTDTAEDIATVLVSMFSPSKARDIFRRGLAKLDERKAARKPADAKIEGGASPD